MYLHNYKAKFIDLYIYIYTEVLPVLFPPSPPHSHSLEIIIIISVLFTLFAKFKAILHLILLKLIHCITY